LFFSGSVIESTTLPITLILSNANYQILLVIVVDSISFQFPITQLPISVTWLVLEMRVVRVACQYGVEVVVECVVELVDLGLEVGGGGVGRDRNWFDDCEFSFFLGYKIKGLGE
jgi:hypothetical protein